MSNVPSITDCPSLLIGNGHFTTFRVVRINQSTFSIVAFENHFQRLLDGCRLLSPIQFPVFSKDEVLDLITNKLISEIQLIDEKSRNNYENDFRIRVTVLPEKVFVSSRAIPSWEHESKNQKYWKICTVESSRPFPKVKSLSSLSSIWSRSYATANGFDEALLLNTNKEALEGSWTNILILDSENNLVTIKGEKLLGITEQIVLKNYEKWTQFKVVALPPQKLSLIHEKAKSIFLTNSIEGIVGVSVINKQKFQKSDLIQMCNQKFRELFTVDNQDRKLLYI